MAFGTSSKIGMNPNATTTTATFGIGDRALGTQDTMWVYVQMNGAATTGMCCTINTGNTATPAITSAAQAAANSLIGFAQTAFADTEFGWLALNGNNVYIRVSGTTSCSQVMYIATTSGCIHPTSASSTLAGVVLIANTSATATNQAVLANLSWPRFVNTGM